LIYQNGVGQSRRVDVFFPSNVNIQDLGYLYLQNVICLNQFALYNKTILFTTNVCYFCSNLAHIIPTTVYLDNIFDLSLFYNESKSEILYTIRLYFILNLHLVSYHTTSKQYKYTWPKNIILLFYAFPFQMTYLI
jgi:hypothetical protein